MNHNDIDLLNETLAKLNQADSLGILDADGRELKDKITEILQKRMKSTIAEAVAASAQIEHENSDYIKLPCDCNGNTLHIGDEVVLLDPQYIKSVIRGIGINGEIFVLDSVSGSDNAIPCRARICRLINGTKDEKE